LLAKYIIVGEELAPEGLIDDGDLGGALVILCREAASMQQGDFHRGKIILAHRLPVGDVLPPGSRFRLAGQQDVKVPIIIRDERDLPECCRAHAGQVIQPRKELLIELQQLFVLVSALPRLQGEDQEVLLIEAQVDVLQIVESADEQTGAY
jgi:hypothetical protein